MENCYFPQSKALVSLENLETGQNLLHMMTKEMGYTQLNHELIS